MRVFITTTIPEARAILANGFTDCYEEGGETGVFVGRRPLRGFDGFHGDVVLAVELPAEVFDNREIWEDNDPRTGGERRTDMALISANVLNQYGPAEIYDHDYSGPSRRELLLTIRGLQQAGSQEHAAKIQEAIAFFDEIGWQTPLKAKEQPAE